MAVVASAAGDIAAADAVAAGPAAQPPRIVTTSSPTTATTDRRVRWTGVTERSDTEWHQLAGTRSGRGLLRQAGSCRREVRTIAVRRRAPERQPTREGYPRRAAQAGGTRPDDRLRRARPLRRRADAGLDRRVACVLQLPVRAGQARGPARGGGLGSPTGCAGSGRPSTSSSCPGGAERATARRRRDRRGTGRSTQSSITTSSRRCRSSCGRRHPYEPAVRDGRLYARGATDNKGELMPRIWGVEAYLAAIGLAPLPGALPRRGRGGVREASTSTRCWISDLPSAVPTVR